MPSTRGRQQQLGEALRHQLWSRGNDRQQRDAELTAAGQHQARAQRP